MVNVNEAQNNELIRISVENFGPVKEGTISIRPLTILFGRNNTGKTYMGYLIWGIASLKSIDFSVELEQYSNIIERIKLALKDYQKKDRADDQAREYFPIPIDYFIGEYALDNLDIKVSKEFIGDIFNFNIKFESGEVLIPKKVDISIGAIIRKSIDDYIRILFDQLESLKLPILFQSHHVCITVHVTDSINVETRTDTEQTKDVNTTDEEENEQEKLSLIITKDKRQKYYCIILLTPKAFKKIDTSHCNAIFENIITGIAKDVISKIFKEKIFIPASKSGLILLSRFVARRSIEERFRRHLKYPPTEEQLDLELDTLPEPIIDFMTRDPSYSPRLYSDEVNESFRDIVDFIEKKIDTWENHI